MIRLWNLLIFEHKNNGWSDAIEDNRMYPTMFTIPLQSEILSTNFLSILFLLTFLVSLLSRCLLIDWFWIGLKSNLFAWWIEFSLLFVNRWKEFQKVMIAQLGSWLPQDCFLLFFAINRKDFAIWQVNSQELGEFVVVFAWRLHNL